MRKEFEQSNPRESAPETILRHAEKVFGTREEGARWLTEPALALDRNRPIDLLATTAGTTQVATLLAQLEYGVYV
jgi:putative toxin-antitoxin system antitoxin component (TIGR02293 family)